MNSAQDLFLNAARHGRLQFVQVLLKQDGVHVHTTDEHGSTALLHAASRGHKETVRFLSKEKANVNATEENQSTAMMLAAERGYDQVARYHNANVNMANNQGKTALQFAAENGHQEIVRFLLTQHADVNSIDADGDTPLIRSVTNGHASIVDLLLKKGANVDTRNLVGKSALDCALERGHLEIAQMVQSVSERRIDTTLTPEDAPESPTPAPALMCQVKFRCGTMQEAEAICTHIYSRLFSLGQQLMATGLIEKRAVQHGFMAILERFHVFLARYGNRRIITRVVSRRMLVSVCQELHEKLDDLIKLCEDDIVGDFLEWKKRFEADSGIYRELLKLALKRNPLWKNELQETNIQAEALTLLLFEHDHRADEYDP